MFYLSQRLSQSSCRRRGGGRSYGRGGYAATFSQRQAVGRVDHGSLSYGSKIKDGQTADVHSILGRPTIPGRPEPAMKDTRPVCFTTSVGDDDALKGVHRCPGAKGFCPPWDRPRPGSRNAEGDGAHVMGWVIVVASRAAGDKDCFEVARTGRKRHGIKTMSNVERPNGECSEGK